MSAEKGPTPSELNEAYQFNELSQKGVVSPEELSRLPKEKGPADLITEKYDLTTREGWESVLQLFDYYDREHLDDLRREIVDIFSPESVKGFHGTDRERLRESLQEGLLSRKAYREKTGRVSTTSWTQQPEEYISYWDLSEIRVTLKQAMQSDEIPPRAVLDMMENYPVYLIIGGKVQRTPWSEIPVSSSQQKIIEASIVYGGMSYDEAKTIATKQPNEGLVMEKIATEDIVGILIPREGQELLFETEVQGEADSRDLAEDRKIFLQAVFNGQPVYDQNGDLLWPVRLNRAEIPKRELAFHEKASNQGWAKEMRVMLDKPENLPVLQTYGVAIEMSSPEFLLHMEEIFMALRQASEIIDPRIEQMWNRIQERKHELELE